MNTGPYERLAEGEHSFRCFLAALDSRDSFDYGTDVTPGEAPVAELLPKGNSREVGGARLGYAFDVLETVDRRTNSNEAPGERIICRGVPLR